MKPSCEMRATLSYETELAQTSHCAHEGIRFVNLLKDFIDKSCGEVSLLEQDTIENVS